ncbi:restriction endonuclease [Acinetobacter indicus]|uniref:Restriction endonuclease n=2 Tax=Moraxellaceae TaxID=468 RepID=A0A7S6VPT2_9GAMM|nr:MULTISPECIES: restriction endonuclease [Acinetobacter]QIC77370.1 restriction endonuclease [Acinetobacter indicus]QOW42683.1 restriction endonuclease [Acinetobacter indicus]
MYTHYDLMKPLIKVMQIYKNEISNEEALFLISKELKLTEADKQLKMQNGKNLIKYRFQWAKTYLKKAGLLEYTSPSNFTLTPLGLNFDLTKIEKFSSKTLSEFDSFKEFRSPTLLLINSTVEVEQDEDLPEEIIDKNSKLLNESLKSDLLALVKNRSSVFFERLVVDLLVAMGYGGSHQDAAQAIGKTNDGGIDGVISEDRLGLDKIYIQAKRWENTVGRPDIQQFKGALADQVAKKGVFITTSSFSKEAIESAKKSGIVLIDGNKLTSLMIEFGLGVQIERSFHIYKIDQDRFDEDNF